MEDGGELSLDAKEVTKQKLKLGCKNYSTVANDRFGKVVISNYYINNYFHKS